MHMIKTYNATNQRLGLFARGCIYKLLCVLALSLVGLGNVSAAAVVTYPEGKMTADPGDIVTVTFDEDITNYEFNKQKLSDATEYNSNIFTSRCDYPQPSNPGEVYAPLTRTTHSITVKIPADYSEPTFDFYYGTRTKGGSEVNLVFFTLCLKYVSYTYGGQITINVHTDQPVLRASQDCVCPGSTTTILAENFNHTTLQWICIDRDNHTSVLTPTPTGNANEYEITIPANITSDVTVTVTGGETEAASATLTLCIPEILNVPTCAPTGSTFTFEVQNACPTMSYKVGPNGVTHSGSTSYQFTEQFTGTSQEPQTFTLYQNNKAVRSFTISRCAITINCSENLPSSFILPANSCYVTLDQVTSYIHPTQNGGSNITSLVYYFTEDGGDFKPANENTHFVPNHTYVVRTNVYVDGEMVDYCDTKAFAVVDETAPVIESGLQTAADSACNQSMIPDLSQFIVEHTTDNCEVYMVSQTPAAGQLITDETDVTVIVSDHSNRTTGTVRVLPNTTMVSKQADTTATACETFTWYGTEYTESGDYEKTFTTVAGCDSVVTLHLTINDKITVDTTAVACETFTWYGTKYTESGSYEKTFTTVAGCDSIVTLQLTINKEIKADTTASACESFTWYGTEYTESGSYEKTFTTVAGCDSIVTLQLTINKEVKADTTASACESFTWYDTEYTESGSYEKTFTTVAGCDSIVTLQLTINKEVKADTTASACESFTWYGTEYTESGSYEKTFTTVAGCDSIVTLQLTINKEVKADTTAAACESFTWYGTEYTESGNYEKTFTTVAGCDSIVTLQLTINKEIKADTTAAACETFTWYGTEYTASGDYEMSFTTAAGCDSIVTLHLTINDKFTVDTTATACETFTWYGTEYTESGEYEKTFTTVAGCDSIVTLQLTINKEVKADTTASACETFTWYGTEYTESGDYEMSFTTVAGCDSIVTLHLTINDKIKADTTASACESFTWYGTEYTESGEYEKTFTTVAGCDSIVTLQLTINKEVKVDTTASACETFTWYGTEYTESGEYEKTFTTVAGCDSIVTLQLTINKEVKADTTASACESFTWYGTEYTESGEYEMTFTTVAGCDSIVTLQLTINKEVKADTTASACESFTWYGTEYTESGNYEKTFTTVAGCDSIVTLQLTINKKVKADTTASACETFTWYGTEYTESGSYEKTFTTVAGCDSIVTLQLTINKEVKVDTTASACESFTWYGTEYTESGSYEKTFTTVAGCDSIVTLQLTINKEVKADTTASACETFTWYGTEYTESGSYEKTFTTVAGCDSIVTLQLTINKEIKADTTASACESFTWYGTEYTASGDYEMSFTTAAGCDSVVTLHLTINDKIKADTTASACESFTWYGTEYTESGSYEKTFTTVAGCDSIVTLQLTINKEVKADTTASACESFTWYGTEYTESGEYEKTFTTVAGCDSIVTLQLTINKEVKADTTASACESFTWYGTEYTASGDYEMSFITAAGCDSIVTLHLTINDKIKADTTASACETFTWYGTEYTASGDYEMSFTTAAGCDSVVTLHLTINDKIKADTTASACETFTWYGTEYTASGDYEMSFTTAAGCDSIVTLHLTINDKIKADTTASACETFTWYGTEYTASGDYEMSFTTAAGCDSVVTLHLTINDKFVVDTTAIACESFTWYGTEYTESGEYEKTFTTATGCDSTVTLNLTIIEKYTSDTTAVACESFVWYGKEYTTSGDYDTTFTTAAGCDSIVTLHLTINENYTADTTAIACESFTWYGKEYTASGDYDTTFVAATGCDSIVTLHLIINEKYTVDTTAVACESFTWYGKEYTASGDYDTTFTTAAGCDSIVKLHLTITDKFVVDTTAVACESFSWYGKVYTASGDYDTTFTTAAGCDSIVTLHLTINENYTADTTAIACESFTWYGKEYTASGDYDTTFVAATGCDSIVTLHLTINEKYMVDTTAVACESFTWYGKEYTASGDYDTTFIATTGCDSTVTLHLTINEKYASDTTVIACKSFSWYGKEYTESGDYDTTLATVAGCDSVVTLHLTITEKYTTDTTAIACKNFTWYGKLLEASGDYDTTLTTTAGCDSVVTLHLTITDKLTADTSALAYEPFIWYGDVYDATGDYEKTFITEAGCDSVVTLHLTIKTLMTVAIKGNTDTAQYDGNLHTVTGFSASVEDAQTALFDASKIVYTGEASASGTHAGSYPMNLDMADFSYADDDFEVTFVLESDGAMELLPRSVILTSASDEKAYDGTPLTNDNVTVSGDGFVSGDNIILQVTGEQLVFGTSKNTFTYTFAEGTLADDYEVTSIFGDLLVYPKEGVIYITAADSSKMYDGTPLFNNRYTANTELLSEGDVLIAEVEGTITNAGSTYNKVISHKVMRGDEDVTSNYTFGPYVNGLLSVSKRNVTFTSATDEKTYDGTALTNDEILISGDGFAEGEGATFEVTGSRTIVGTSDNSFTYELNEGTLLDNYTITTEVGTLTILPIKSVVVTITEHADSFEYNGQVREVVGFDWSSSDPEYTHADFDFIGSDTVRGQHVGRYGMGLQESDFINRNTNYDSVSFVIIHDSLTIVPFPNVIVIITEQSDSVMYDGLPHTVTGYTYTKNEPLYSLSDFVFTGEDKVTGTDVGRYSMQLESSDFKNLNPDFDGVQFIINHSNLVIYPWDTVYVTIREHADTLKFNGQTQRVTGYDMEASTSLYEPQFITFTGDSVASRLHVGEFEMNLTAEDFSNHSKNFAHVIFTVVDGVSLIEPMEELTVHIKGHKDELTYNASEQEVTGFDFESDVPFYTLDDFTFTGVDTARGTNVGSYSMNLKAEDFANINPDYQTVNFVVEDGSLSITPLKELEVIITEHTDTFIYDGSEHTVAGYDFSCNNPDYTIESITFTGVDQVSGGEVGTYPMDLKAEDFANINPNYEDVQFTIVHKDLVVLPKKDVIVTVVSHTDTLIYNGESQSISGYEISINTDLYQEKDFNFMGDSTVQGTEVGEYPMTLQAGDFVNTNNNFEDVEFVVTNQNLVIVPDTSVVVKIMGHTATLTYNGEEQIVSGYDVQIDHPLYQASDFVFNGDSIAKGTTVGEYAMNLQSSDFVNQNKNFSQVRFEVINGSLSIKPLEGVTVQIVEHGDVVVYDGVEHEVTGYDVILDSPLYQESDFVFNGQDTVRGTAIGNYPMELKESDFQNINENFNNVQFIIQNDSLVIEPNKSVVVTITGHVDTFVYNGETQEIAGYEVSINNDAYTLSDFQFTGNDVVSGIDAGLYEMSLNASDFVNINSNFDSVSFVIVQGHMVINPREYTVVTITENAKSFIYDGTEHEVTGYEITTDDELYQIASVTYAGDSVVRATNVGEYSMQLDPTEFTNTDPNFTNVVFRVQENLTKILPLENVTVTIREKGDSIVYDAQEHTLSGYEVTISSPLYTESDFQFTGDSLLSATNVGSYTMDLKAEQFVNQNPNFANVQFEVEHDSLYILPLTGVVVTVIEPSDTFSFDGEEHELTGYQLRINSDIYKEEYIDFTGVDTVRGTFVGTYHMNLKEEDFANNNANFESVQFVVKHDSMLIISERAVTVLLKMNGDTAVYDGKEHVVSGYYVTYISDPLYSENDFTFEGASEDTIARRTNVGRTEMELPVEDFVNHNKNFSHVNFLVAHSALVILPKPALTVYVKENADTFTYDGAEHSVSGYTMTTEDSLYQLSDFEYNGDTVVTAINAGKYSMNLQDSLFINHNMNYDTVIFVVEHDSMVITPISGVVVSIKGKRDTIDYDGLTHTLKGSTRTSNNELYDPYEDVTYVGDAQLAKGYQAGIYFMGLNAEDFVNLNPNFTDVKFVVEDGYLCIQKIDRLIIITANSASKVYDGVELVSKGYSYTRNFLDSIGDYVVAQVVGSITNVGAINNEVVTYRIYNHAGEDVTDNYTNVKMYDGVLEVRPRKITLESVSGEKEYDGTPLTVDSVIVGGEGLAAVDTVLFTVTGSQLDAGSSANTFTYEVKGDPELIKNYQIDIVEGTLTVVPNSTPITIVAASDHKYYDNLPLENPTYKYTEGVIAPGDSLVVIVEGSITDVGSTENVVVEYYVIRDGVDVTANYTFGEIYNGLLEVLYSEHTYIVYGDEDKIIMKNVHAPVRVYDALGRYILSTKSWDNSEYRVDDYFEWRVPKQGTYYVRILGETIKVVTK